MNTATQYLTQNTQKSAVKYKRLLLNLVSCTRKLEVFFVDTILVFLYIAPIQECYIFSSLNALSFYANIQTFFTDVHVFIGARSNVNQTQWIWSDQRIVTNARFSAANSSSCQQIAMRYFYNDTLEKWINTAQSCNNTKAYYVCETIIECKI